METGDDLNSGRIHVEEQAIREVTEPRAPQFAVGPRKLLRILAQTRNNRFKFIEKPGADTGRMLIVPIKRVGEIALRGRG